MDNTETKKKTKIGIFDIVVIGFEAVILGLFIYLKIAGGELFLFGYVWYVNFILVFFQMVMFISFFISWIGQPKSKKRIICMTLCAVMFVLQTGVIVWYVYDDTKNITDTEQITLSDGNEILLKERISHYKIGETRFEDTYMDVYQINGITAKKLGKIDETYFSNKCLLQDKYAYEYDEVGKKLTVICEYGTYGDSVVRLKEEYDTGFWSEEFTLE